MDEVGQGLVQHLRKTLGQPGLDLAEPLAPLTGGFDTEIYTAHLRDAPPAFAAPLVLRVLRPHHDPARVLREQVTQNALANQGYPAPRVLLATLDPAPLGAPFLLMQRMPGVPAIGAGPIRMQRVLLEAQLRLHALDPEPLARALGESGTFDGYLGALEGRVERASLTGLAPLLRWLRERRPRPDVAPVVCHGDLHPQNILVDGAALTGVLDWPNALVAEPAFDIASTRNILRFVPAGLVTSWRPLGWLIETAQPMVAARYIANYRSRRPVEADRLPYYEVAAAMRALVRTGEVRRRIAGSSPGPLDTSAYIPRLLAHATRVTGIAASLPSEP